MRCPASAAGPWHVTRWAGMAARGVFERSSSGLRRNTPASFARSTLTVSGFTPCCRRKCRSSFSVMSRFAWPFASATSIPRYRPWRFSTSRCLVRAAPVGRRSCWPAALRDRSFPRGSYCRAARRENSPKDCWPHHLAPIPSVCPWAEDI